MKLEREIVKIAGKAKEASRALGLVPSEKKNSALRAMAKELIRAKKFIINENKKDLIYARDKGLSWALIDRLTLNEKRIRQMAESLKEVARLKDPVGEVTELGKRPNGLVIGKMLVPIGLILVIYESRPNVTADCVGLCLKAGNGIILRGGSEAINSNISIFKTLARAAKRSGLPENSINLIMTRDRKAVDVLLRQSAFIDLVIPRGGESLINQVAKKSRIPVIKHYKGVCHVYVDEFANLGMAETVSFNAKVNRPGVCNAMETLLVHRRVAKRFLPGMAERFVASGVELRGCRETVKILKGVKIKRAKESDWGTEYLDLILSVKVVGSIDEAISHITRYGTAHSDAIITENVKKALKFLQSVDSASVYVNASTRFTDGFEFGMGAEMGISTDKIHARGPMGVRELVTYKYIIFGNGQIRK